LTVLETSFRLKQQREVRGAFKAGKERYERSTLGYLHSKNHAHIVIPNSLFGLPNCKKPNKKKALGIYLILTIATTPKPNHLSLLLIFSEHLIYSVLYIVERSLRITFHHFFSKNFFLGLVATFLIIIIGLKIRMQLSFFSYGYDLWDVVPFFIPTYKHAPF